MQSGPIQQSKATEKIDWLNTYLKKKKNQPDLFSCHELKLPDSFIFLTLHWLLYSSKTIQERNAAKLELGT